LIGSEDVRPENSLMIARQQGDWLVAKVGDERVMMSRERIRHIGVTEVGMRIWELIETPQEVDAICAQLRKEYAITPEACRAEVESFLKELLEHSAVRLDPEPVA
jgi:hypothetical protein